MQPTGGSRFRSLLRFNRVIRLNFRASLPPSWRMDKHRGVRYVLCSSGELRRQSLNSIAAIIAHWPVGPGIAYLWRARLSLPRMLKRLSARGVELIPGNRISVVTVMTDEAYFSRHGHHSRYISLPGRRSSKSARIYTVDEISADKTVVDPGKKRAKAARQACGVVMRAWKRLETSAAEDRSVGGRWDNACVRISAGHQYRHQYVKASTAWDIPLGN